MANDTKHCRRCDKTKPLDDFGNNRTSKDGKQTYCRECNRDMRKGKPATSAGGVGRAMGPKSTPEPKPTKPRRDKQRRVVSDIPIVGRNIDPAKAEPGKSYTIVYWANASRQKVTRGKFRGYHDRDAHTGQPSNPVITYKVGSVTRMLPLGALIHMTRDTYPKDIVDNGDNDSQNGNDDQ